MVAGGTLASHFLQLGPTHSVHLVGHIPLGLPYPEMPPLQLMWEMAFQALPLTIVAYTISLSMALMMAQKNKYEVRPNQELVALVGKFTSYTYNFKIYYLEFLQYGW